MANITGIRRNLNRSIKPIVRYPAIMPLDQAAKLAAAHARGSNLDHQMRWLIIAMLLKADQHLMASADVCKAIAASIDTDIATIGHHLRKLAAAGLISNTRLEDRSSLYWLGSDQAQHFSQVIQEVSNAS